MYFCTLFCVYMRKVICLFLLFSACLTVMASDRHVVRGVGHGDYHFGYISLSGGYTSLSQNVENVTTKGSWGAMVGAGYEFRMHNGWVSVGIHVMQEQSTTTPNSVYCWKSPVGGWDNERDQVEYYQYKIRQTDKQLFRTVDIPLLAGYYNNGFYVGAGFKVGFSVGSSITTQGEFDMGAKYKDGIDVVEHVNAYQLYTLEQKKYEGILRPQVSLLGEIGYDLLSNMTSNSTVCHMLKIGLYAEYGLRSIHPIDTMDPIQLNGMNFAEAAKVETDATAGQVTPYYFNTQTEGKRIAPFYVGVKLTYLIGGSWSTTRTWHKGCQCYE